MNKALLAKLSWCLLICGEETPCKVVRDKYMVSDDKPLLFKNKQRESNIWKEIVWSSELLRSGLCWRLSNGRKALFWVNVWTREVPLPRKSIIQVEEELLSDPMCSLWEDATAGNGKHYMISFNHPSYFN